MSNIVATITLDPNTKRIVGFKPAEKKFRFKCKRCASLCCKLGGPVLTKKDVDLIVSAGYLLEDFLEPKNMNEKERPSVYGSLKSRNDGSCIFLKANEEKNAKCNIYDSRPILCRLYPFTFEKIHSNSIVLKVIPCCRGLNNFEGKTLDEEFISSCLLEPLLEAMKLLSKKDS
jgi:Fe-S-cluster containining protein